MTDKYLKFLDFALPVLCEEYPDGELISILIEKYNVENNPKLEYKDAQIIQELYEYEYFEIINNLGSAKIYAEWKVKIESYGSLSKYLESIETTTDIIQPQANPPRKIKRSDWVIIILTIVILERYFNNASNIR